MGGAGDPEPATEPDRNGPAGGATPWSRGTQQWDAERHEGNGRGDAVRLPAGSNPSKGANRAVRSAGDVRDPRAPDAADAKHGEPQDRERDATSLQPPRGGTRRGGEKPRGRNEMSTPGCVDPNRAPARGSRRAAGHPVEGREAHQPHERQEPSGSDLRVRGEGFDRSRELRRGGKGQGGRLRRVRPSPTTTATGPRGPGR
jgi:hypothetical protein